MQFAVVDIETTGGYAAENGITEIAVFITDGSSITDSYYALLDPEVRIPSFIESLTGITNEKVQGQPVFGDIAAELHAILSGKIFVAHNVNFDYSFLHHHLNRHGFYLDSRKLCTIRLGRRMIPGLKGYGLDKICNHLNIGIRNRHSAMGDASATTELLHLLIARGAMNAIHQMLKTSGEMSLPPNVSRANIRLLPSRSGIYMFHDKKGKVLYVGKAINIKKRVISHFTNNKIGWQKQEFLKSIYEISYQETATELMAIILESIEIKKKWPVYNRSQKHHEQLFGLYTYTDSGGYQRLFVEKKLKHIDALYSFNYLTEGYALLRRLIQSYELCPRMCFMVRSKNGDASAVCCEGNCAATLPARLYNERVARCIDELTANLPSFAVFDKGRKPGEKSFVLIEQGRFIGMGYMEAGATPGLDEIRRIVKPYPDNNFIRSAIFKYAEKHPYQTLSFSGINFSSHEQNTLRLTGLAPNEAM